MIWNIEGIVAGIVGAVIGMILVARANRKLMAMPCPKCEQSLGNKLTSPRTFRQVLLGGWTCPKCGTDVDRKGRVRASA